MNILFVCPSVPALDSKGFQILAYQRIKYLSEAHNICLLCYGDLNSNAEAISELIKLGVNVNLIKFKKSIALFNAFIALTDDATPFQCAVYTSGEFKRKYIQILNAFMPDFVVITTIRVIKNIDIKRSGLILDLVDSMGLNFARRVLRAPWWSRFFWRIEHKRVTKLEKFSASITTASFVVSKIDKDYIAEQKINVLPIGIDFEKFHAGPSVSKSVIVFTGNMSYLPNVEAAVWFAKKCWPSILERYSNAVFIIAGNRPADSIKALSSSPNIRVLGHVDNMADIIRTAQIAVAPMRSGSGMQFKILEAMACGVPVISTTLGLGDIHATPGKEIIIADNPVEFIEKIIALMDSFESRQSIGQSGREFVRREHSWDSINLTFENFLKSQLQLIVR